MADHLLPCPFCGGEPHVMHCGAGTYMVQCLQCKSTTDDGCLDRISANWNRRDMFDDLRELIIAAREFWDANNDLSEESRALDKALEAFGERVPYENEPSDARASSGTAPASRNALDKERG